MKLMKDIYQINIGKCLDHYDRLLLLKMVTVGTEWEWERMNKSFKVNETGWKVAITQIRSTWLFQPN